MGIQIPVRQQRAVLAEGDVFLAQPLEDALLRWQLGVLRGIHAGVATMQRNRNSSSAMQLPYEIAGFTDLGQESNFARDRDARR